MPTRDLVVDLAPTLAQARAAADVLKAEGASAVLLFGSLARGEAREHSDLDLLVVFDDLDYDERVPRSWRLSDLCRAATNKDVDVLLTDWPEWEHRVNEVKSSLEADILRYGQWLFRNEPNTVRVNWEKEIGMPATNLEEAATHLKSIRKTMSDMQRSCVALPMEHPVVDGVPTVDYESRELRLTGLCAHSALAIEHTIKCLTALSGRHPKYTHDISKLLQNCPEVPNSILEALEPLRVNTLRNAETAPNAPTEYNDISCWRTFGTYMLVDESINLDVLGHLAVRLCAAALASTETTLHQLRDAGINADDKQFALCRSTFEVTLDVIARHNIVAGAPLTGPATATKKTRWFRRRRPDQIEAPEPGIRDDHSLAFAAEDLGSLQSAVRRCNKPTVRGGRCKRIVVSGNQCPDHD